MGHAIRSEWVKFRSLTSNVVLLLIAVAVGLGLSVLVAAVVPADEVDPGDGFALAVAGLPIATFVLGVLGILAITQEYRFNLSKVTFAAEPHRLRVVAAKLVVVGLVVAVTAAVVVALELLVARSILEARDVPVDLDGTALRAALGLVVVAVLYAVIGLGLGAILRNPAAAIPIFVLWPLIVEPLVGLWSPIRRWLPFSATQSFTSVTPVQDVFGPWAGLAYFTAFAVVVLVVGAILVQRRDA